MWGARRKEASSSSHLCHAPVLAHFPSLRISPEIRNFVLVCENAIRPFVLGRKAWLFSNTEGGAEASAFYYSMVETAKSNGVNVSDYLWYCLDEAPRCKTDGDWEKLLPWNMDAGKISELKQRRASAVPDPARTEAYVLRGAH